MEPELIIPCLNTVKTQQTYVMNTDINTMCILLKQIFSMGAYWRGGLLKKSRLKWGLLEGV